MENKILKKELKKSFEFFIKEANCNKNSKGYGLIRDKSKLSPQVASIASTGYGLAALIIGVEHKWISYKYAYDRANGTLDTFIKNMESINGFFYHFINIETTEREWKSEVSIIDTGIFICGALLVGEYFGGEVQQKSETLYKKINWQWYTDKNVNQFYMGYTKENGFWVHWDMYAEQLMLYILGAGSPTFPIDKSMYYDLEIKKADYKEIKDIIYTYCGTLFTYQYSHAWIDFRNLEDKNGINWFENSVKATKANRQYCIDNSNRFKTFSENSWGLTPCIGPKGYSGGFGAMPAETNLDEENNGTISPSGAAGSIIFTPELSIKALKNYYNNFPKLWGKYGFKDGYNLEGTKEWYAEEYIGIDKGITMIMIENYFSGLIWKYFMKNKYVMKGLENLEIYTVIKKQKRKITNYI